MQRKISHTLIILLISVSFLVLCLHATSKSDLCVEEVLSSKLVSISPDKTMDFQDIEIRTLYRDIHYMANTLVVSGNDFYYGNLEITKKRLEAAIEKANRLPLRNKDRILEILTRWQKRDYSQAVEDHNYVCGKTEKATKLKPELNLKVN